MPSRRSFLSAISAVYGIATLQGLAAAANSSRREYHVSPQGNDHNTGSPSRPLKTISAAAALAQAGDVITVHEGVYRERIAPPRGGLSDAKRIVYQAAPGEQVVITGAEIATGWSRVKYDVWKVVIPNSFFGSFNPYSDLIHGDWFDAKKRKQHTGAVYLNGDWLVEAAQIDDLYQPLADSLWFGQVDETTTTLFAQFKGMNPNEQHTEINVRQTVFYPEKTDVNYITVRGFRLRQAATPWAPPTAEQIGLIGTHWSKGWIIEDNVISHSACSGISLGKYGDQFDNQSHNSANGYVETIQRAVAFGWSKENIGHHIVRRNKVSYCEQAGVIGSLGAIFSVVTDNVIHDIHVRRLFSGAEIAGIKFHAAIDTEISRNVIYRSYRGLWLDWMAQGTHVSRNLFYDNDAEDIFVEVSHGPFLVDNNLFLSKVSLRNLSQGGAYVHNLFCGGTTLADLDRRMTPYMKAHSTEIVGLHDNPSGDMRFYNNLFAQAGDLSPFNAARLPMQLGGNVFVGNAKLCTLESAPLTEPEFDPKIGLSRTKDNSLLAITLNEKWGEQPRKIVTTELLGNAIVPDLPFERPNETPVRIDTDYSGRKRNPTSPFPGPFECPIGGRQSIRIIS
jgi:alpha-L-arabinofuranosidase